MVVTGVAAVMLILLVGGCPQPDSGGGGNPSVQYTITFNSHGGSEVAAVTEHEGTEVPRPTDPAWPDYTFSGWYSAETGGTLCNWPYILTEDITLHAQWLPLTPVTVSLWVNEDDGTILVSDNDVTISKTGSGGSGKNPDGFTAAVSGEYTGVRWYLHGAYIPGNSDAPQSVTFNAADYATGTYILGVTVTKNGIPYSTDIRFTVED
jgi:uncharacterized repeat protein (TIGR02543 family)